MWIRSQDGKMMVNLDITQNIRMRKVSLLDDDHVYAITCDDLEVARYSSADQAMVRLDQIRDDIHNCTGVVQMPEDVKSWKDMGSRWLPSDYGFF